MEIKINLECIPYANTQNPVNQMGLQLNPIKINEDYCKEWKINMRDYCCLTKNGELLRNTLYRLGGLSQITDLKNKYFMLIKHVEAYYSEDIMRMSKSKDNKHLESRWCILNQDGVEKAEFPSFTHPYLVKNSCLYSFEGKYYNIETGEFYCHTSHAIESTDYLFLENCFDKDESKRGIMKINKKDGTFELFK